MQGLGSGVLPEGVEHSLFCILAERINLQTHCLLVQDASLILVIAEITSDSTEFNYLLVVGWPRTNVEKFKFWECPGGSMVRTPYFHCRGHGFDPWLDHILLSGPKNGNKFNSDSQFKYMGNTYLAEYKYI